MVYIILKCYILHVKAIKLCENCWKKVRTEISNN